ncbi:cell wall / vacuolar inhibitor of fructosidase 2 [Aristolochia californica]|uniref:cell wall / vacuolar inhibitor of fructosidase 2 n=1 Tax=Aristolochia californica TaxID=171875 RepID=UPI0035D6A088
MGLLVPLLFLLFFNRCSFFVTADKDLIQKTCQTTKYYGLCVSSLQIDPKSLQSDVPGLAAIITTLAIANASDTAAYLVKLLNHTTDSSLKSVLQECSNRYKDAGAALGGSLQELDSQTYDYAYVQVMAAKDYPNSCHNVFKQKPKLVYPLELKRREEGLERLCDVALGIISLLGFD